MGVGEAVGDKKVMDFAVGDMEKIAGQKAIVTKAKSRSPGSRSVMAGLSAAKSPCVATGCTNSSIA